MQRFVTDENRKWWTLGAVSVGLFMIMLDNTIVNVALPSIRRDLGMSLESLEWIVAGYALTFAAFMLTGGKLADFLGRRLIFMAGLIVFFLQLIGVGVLVYLGVKKVKRVRAPEQTIQITKETVDYLKKSRE